MRTTLDLVLNAVTSESEFSPRMTKLLSLASLAIAASLCFMTYSYPTLFGLREKNITPSPKLLSGAIALAMLAPLYARDILKWSKSVYGLISFVLFWLVFAGLVEIAIGGGGKSRYHYYLLGGAVLLSWLGMRGVAGVAWMLAFAACIVGLVTSNLAMGPYGFVFLASGSIGCILHSGMGPADLIAGMKDEFSSQGSKANQRISEDVAATRRMMNL